MYQILDYALKDPSNKTRFTLIFANLTEKDILMKEEFDALRKKYSKTLNVVYTVDKAEPGWQGECSVLGPRLCAMKCGGTDVCRRLCLCVQVRPAM